VTRYRKKLKGKADPPKRRRRRRRRLSKEVYTIHDRVV
jgi:hypothetical protein